jgi:hypothetical protein
VKTISIRYRFTLPNGREHDFMLELDKDTAELVTKTVPHPPAWTALEYQKCTNCPLTPKVKRCPSALHLAGVIDRFADLVSYDNIHVAVETEERSVSAQLSAQQGLASLIGVIMASSGCPRTAIFRSMARFHLPFSSESETAFRSAAMYLLAQYFIARDGGTPDVLLEKLEDVYSGVHVVNKGMAQRLRAATTQDAILNAVVLLDVNTTLVPVVIHELLTEMRPAFQALLQSMEPDAH